METLLRKWDGESTIIRFDRPTHAWIIIAIHSTRLGPATGGTRMKPYPDLRAALSDALKLAASMTYKPDYVINFGGAIAITGIEDMGWSRVEAEEKVKSVRETLRRIFEVAAAEGLTTDATARRMAESRLSGT